MLLSFISVLSLLQGTPNIIPETVQPQVIIVQLLYLQKQKGGNWGRMTDYTLSLEDVGGCTCPAL